jgi:hypothetical protein
MLAPDETPHLIKLHLGERQVFEQMRVNLMGFLRRTLKPHPDGF